MYDFLGHVNEFLKLSRQILNQELGGYRRIENRFKLVILIKASVVSWQVVLNLVAIN